MLRADDRGRESYQDMGRRPPPGGFSGPYAGSPRRARLQRAQRLPSGALARSQIHTETRVNAPDERRSVGLLASIWAFWYRFALIFPGCV